MFLHFFLCIFVYACSLFSLITGDRCTKSLQNTAAFSDILRLFQLSRLLYSHKTNLTVYIILLSLNHFIFNFTIVACCCFQCSTPCGDGQRIREVQCVDLQNNVVSDDLCLELRPVSEDHCNLGECGKGWFFTEWPSEVGPQL